MKISNSKKQLARIISGNGGWREVAKFAAQDQDGEVFLYTAKPTRSGGWWLHDGGLCGVCIVRDEALPNWHQTILSRDEYFHLHPTQDDDGWIEWKGGECPVSEDAIVDVEFHFGSIVEARPAKSLLWDIPIRCHGSDIKSYRIHKPKQSIERLCADVTAQNKHTNVDVTTTIEQLAAEYRNRKDYADRKQQEADAAKVEAEAKLKELVAAGKSVGLVVSVAAPEPELIITSIVGLIEGDVIELTAGERYNKTECTMVHIDGVGLRAKSASDTVNQWWNLGGPQDYDWRFIRRP